MLKAIHPAYSTFTIKILDKENVVGQLKWSWKKGRRVFILPEQEEFQCQFGPKAFELLQNNTVVLSATRDPGVYFVWAPPGWNINFDGDIYRLEIKHNFFKISTSIYKNKTLVGTIRCTKWYIGNYDIDLPDTTPLHLQIFLFQLYLLTLGID